MTRLIVQAIVAAACCAWACLAWPNFVASHAVPHIQTNPARANFSSGTSLATVFDKTTNFTHIWVSDALYRCIRRVEPGGRVSLVAGNPLYPISHMPLCGDGSIATQCTLVSVRSIAALCNDEGRCQEDARLWFVASTPPRVWFLNASGILTRIAGINTFNDGGQFVDGPALQALITETASISVSQHPLTRVVSVWLVDTKTNRVRIIDAGGSITTVVGNSSVGYSGDDGPALAATLNAPSHVAATYDLSDDSVSLWIADTANFVIRHAKVGGNITTIAGSRLCSAFACPSPSATMLLPATQSWFGTPTLIRAVQSGNETFLWFVGSANAAVFKVDVTQHTISRAAYSGAFGSTGDGQLAAEANTMTIGTMDVVEVPAYPRVRILTGSAGFPQGAGAVRQVDESGRVSTLWGPPSVVSSIPPNPLSATLSSPSRIAAVRTAGNDTWLWFSTYYVVYVLFPNNTLAAAAGIPGVYGYNGDERPASTASLYYPRGLCVLELEASGAPQLWIADTQNHRIRTVFPNGSIATVAGTGVEGYGSVGVPARQTQLTYPAGVAAWQVGNASQVTLWVTCVYSYGIIRIDGATGMSSYATSYNRFSPDTIAIFPDPLTGDIYVFVAQYSPYLIVKINDATGDVLPVVGENMATSCTFNDDGIAAEAVSLCSTAGLAVAPSGVNASEPTIFFADSHTSIVRRMDGWTRTVSTFAGRFAMTGYTDDLQSAATQTPLNWPSGLAVSGTGDDQQVWIVDSNVGVIRAVNAFGIIRTVAGIPRTTLADDGSDPILAFGSISNFHAVRQSSGSFNVWLADSYRSVIWRMNPDGAMVIVAGRAGLLGWSGDGGPAVAATLKSPAAVAVRCYDGNVCDEGQAELWIADNGNARVRHVDTVGTIRTIAGTGAVGYNGDGMLATAAYLNYPYRIAVSVNMTDNRTIVWIADSYRNAIRRVDTSGIISTVTANVYSSTFSVQVIASTGDEYLWFLDANSNQVLRRLHVASGDSAIVAHSVTSFAVAPVVQSINDTALWMVRNARHCVERWDVATNITVVVAGQCGIFESGADGMPAVQTLLRSPYNLAVDVDSATGNTFLWFVDDSTRLRHVRSDGIIITVAASLRSRAGPLFRQSFSQTPTLSFTDVAIAVVPGADVPILFVAENKTHAIHQLNADGGMRIVAGGRYAGSVVQNVSLDAATLFQPSGMAAIACSSSGSGGSGSGGSTIDAHLWFADSFNHRVRYISCDGTISTVAGDGYALYRGDDGPARDASLRFPSDVALLWSTSNQSSRLWVADAGNDCVRVVDLHSRHISSAVGQCSIPGYGGDGGRPLDALLRNPSGVAVLWNAGTTEADVWIADTGNNVVRLVTQSRIRTVAGHVPGTPYIGHQLALGATLVSPRRVAVASQTGRGNPDFVIADNAGVHYVNGSTGRLSTLTAVDDGTLHDARMWQDGAVSRLARLAAPILGVAVSPDGARIWAVQSGVLGVVLLTAQPPANCTPASVSLTFEPTPDASSSQLASVSSEVDILLTLRFNWVPTHASMPASEVACAVATLLSERIWGGGRAPSLVAARLASSADGTEAMSGGSMSICSSLVAASPDAGEWLARNVTDVHADGASYLGTLRRTAAGVGGALNSTALANGHSVVDVLLRVNPQQAHTPSAAEIEFSDGAAVYCAATTPALQLDEQAACLMHASCEQQLSAGVNASCTPATATTRALCASLPVAQNMSTLGSALQSALGIVTSNVSAVPFQFVVDSLLTLDPPLPLPSVTPSPSITPTSSATPSPSGTGTASAGATHSATRTPTPSGSASASPSSRNDTVVDDLLPPAVPLPTPASSTGMIAVAVAVGVLLFVGMLICAAVCGRYRKLQRAQREVLALNAAVTRIVRSVRPEGPQSRRVGGSQAQGAATGAAASATVVASTIEQMLDGSVFSGFLQDQMQHEAARRRPGSRAYARQEFPALLASDVSTRLLSLPASSLPSSASAPARVTAKFAADAAAVDAQPTDLAELLPAGLCELGVIDVASVDMLFATAQAPAATSLMQQCCERYGAPAVERVIHQVIATAAHASLASAQARQQTAQRLPSGSASQRSNFDLLNVPTSVAFDPNADRARAASLTSAKLAALLEACAAAALPEWQEVTKNAPRRSAVATASFAQRLPRADSTSGISTGVVQAVPPDTSSSTSAAGALDRAVVVMLAVAALQCASAVGVEQAAVAASVVGPQAQRVAALNNQRLLTASVRHVLHCACCRGRTLAATYSAPGASMATKGFGAPAAFGGDASARQAVPVKVMHLAPGILEAVTVLAQASAAGTGATTPATEVKEDLVKAAPHPPPQMNFLNPLAATSMRALNAAPLSKPSTRRKLQPGAGESAALEPGAPSTDDARAPPSGAVLGVLRDQGAAGGTAARGLTFSAQSVRKRA